MIIELSTCQREHSISSPDFDRVFVFFFLVRLITFQLFYPVVLPEIPVPLGSYETVAMVSDSVITSGVYPTVVHNYTITILPYHIHMFLKCHILKPTV